MRGNCDHVGRLRLNCPTEERKLWPKRSRDEEGLRNDTDFPGKLRSIPETCSQEMKGRIKILRRELKPLDSKLVFAFAEKQSLKIDLLSVFPLSMPRGDSQQTVCSKAVSCVPYHSEEIMPAEQLGTEDTAIPEAVDSPEAESLCHFCVVDCC